MIRYISESVVKLGHNFRNFSSAAGLRAITSTSRTPVAHPNHFTIFDWTICLAFQTEPTNTSHLNHLSLNNHANEIYVLQISKNHNNWVKTPPSKGKIWKTWQISFKNEVLRPIKG